MPQAACKAIAESRQTFADEVLHGLSKPPKRLPCKYIYDERGSELFSRITGLAEYYLTQCEMEILETRKADISQRLCGQSVNLVELGAGDGCKTRVLIDELLCRGIDFTYVPIDISSAAVSDLSSRLAADFSDLCVNGIASDYFDGLKWLSSQVQGRNMVLFLGSTIGNLTPAAQSEFLDNLRRAVNPGDFVLIGFDLLKDVDTILRAYNDGQGVTAAFNKNILARINRELGGQFELDRFRFFSTWDAACRAVQSYLISRCDQRVYVEALGRGFAFYAREAIHTESSHKFTWHRIDCLARNSAFRPVARYTDAAGYFADGLWQAV